MQSNLFPLPEIDQTLCIACGACESVCPTGTVVAREGSTARLDTTHTCDLCAACEDICPTGAISVPFRIEFYTPPGN